MIVFVTDELPKPSAAGHLALNHAIISWLCSQGYDVTIMLTGMRLAAPLERYELAHVCGPYVRRIGAFTVATPKATGKILFRKLLRCLPVSLAGKLRRAKHQSDAVLGKFPYPAEIRWFTRALARLKPNVVVIDTIFRAQLLAASELPKSNRILITHDVFHRRAEALEMAGYRVQPEGLTKQREAQLLANAFHIAAIQPDEADLLRDMCPQANVFTAPMPALPCPPAPETERIAGLIVFIGSNTLPNLDGLRWFFAEIWPEMRGRGITLDLIGDCGPALHRLPPGVNILGRVPDLAPILHRATLAISPLRVGSGLKIKLLDYARHGLFTVATPSSLQGFSTGAASPFIAAGSAAMFAEQSFSTLPHHLSHTHINCHYDTAGASTGCAPLCLN